MKLQRTTLILLLLAFGLGGFVYFYEIRGASVRDSASETKQPIFGNFVADDIQSLTIKRNSGDIIIERSTSPDPPKWLLKAPQTAPASDASVSYLTDLLVKGVQNRIISSEANQLSQFGLDQPQATIEIKLKNQKTHRLIIGKPDFNNSFLYAQADPSINKGANTKVLLVSKDFQNAVNREISEWQQNGQNSQSSSPLPLPTLTPPSPSPKN